MKPIRSHDFVIIKARNTAGKALLHIITAVREFSGSMSCAKWELEYPEFVDWTEDQLHREMEVRRAEHQLWEDRE